MKLIAGWGVEIEDPSEKDIEQTLNAMPGGENSFVILEASALNFIQAAGGDGKPVVVEAWDDNTSRSFRVKDDSLELSKAIRLFQSFLLGEGEWQLMVEWEMINLDGATKPGGKGANQKYFPTMIKAFVLPVALSILCLIAGAMANHIYKNPGGTYSDASFPVPLVIATLTIFLVVGGIFYFAPIVSRRQAAERVVLLARGVEVKGTLLNLQRRVSHSEEMGKTTNYFIVCRYETESGSVHKKFEVAGPSRYSIGDPLTIVYNPDKPKSALFKNHKQQSQWKNWSPPTFTHVPIKKNLRNGLLLGLAASLTTLLAGFIPLFIDMPEKITSQKIGGCGCFPLNYFLWSAFATSTLWLLSKLRRHQQVLSAYRCAGVSRTYYEPASAQRLAACPYCARWIIPGTRTCPYCGGMANMGGISLLVSGSVFFVGLWGQIFIFTQAARIDIDVLLALLLMLGLGAYGVVKSIEEQRFWAGLKKSADSIQGD
jgi:hypothetical protein